MHGDQSWLFGKDSGSPQEPEWSIIKSNKLAQFSDPGRLREFEMYSLVH